MAARYFDGTSSRAHPVGLGVAAGHLVLSGGGIDRRVAAYDIEVSEPGVSRMRVLHFRGGGSLEADEAELLALLTALGLRDSAVARHQMRWSMALGALVLLVLLALGAWAALPFVADRVARVLPANAIANVGKEALALLDRTHFDPTEVPLERQNAITDRLALVAGSDRLPGHTLLFRKAPRIGANAFALPSGDVVLTDELIALAEHDDEIIGVLAHELGHLDGRHALRGAVQSSAVAVASAVYFGDVSSLGAGLSAFLIQAKYSRDFEREADRYAEAFLRRHDIPPARLGAILERMERSAGAADSDAASGYLSTHPVTEERIRELLAP